MVSNFCAESYNKDWRLVQKNLTKIVVFVYEENY